MKKLKDLVMGTSIMWLPIVALYVASKLSQLITGEMLINFFVVIGILSAITLIIIDRKEAKYEKRNIRRVSKKR